MNQMQLQFAEMLVLAIGLAAVAVVILGIFIVLAAYLHWRADGRLSTGSTGCK